jgi:peptidoglycan/xylan/chitin deacetylase (PgdA/CDA1 family)
MTIKAQVGKLRRSVVSCLCSRNVLLGDLGPLISFSFDDFPRTALTVGGRILKSYGFRGTYYASIGLLNTSNELGEQFRREDLDTVLSDGHELASHTFSHVSCYSLSRAQFVGEVEKGRRAIEELTGEPDSGSFAFPFGEVTLSAKKTVGPVTASSRGIWSGLNGPNVDLNLLRANSLYGGQEKYDLVRELILENERRKQWLIFYSHDVSEMPSRYGCTPKLLEFAVELAAKRNCQILTVQEAVAELTKCQYRSIQRSRVAI